MKFVHCKRDPHKDWGVNDPINMEHCLTYSSGTAEDGPAHAIHFTMTGCKFPITWSFVDERHRDWELGRLQELTHEPNGDEELQALLADGPVDGANLPIDRDEVERFRSRWREAGYNTEIFKHLFPEATVDA
jgi:hypothetical protein